MSSPEITVIREHKTEAGVYVLAKQEHFAPDYTTWSVEFYDRGDISQWHAQFNNEYDAFHVFDAVEAGRLVFT